jgi:hypothetical protein
LSTTRNPVGAETDFDSWLSGRGIAVDYAVPDRCPSG